MTIVTQDFDLINYASVKRISSYSAEISNPDTETENHESVYVVVALDMNISNDDDAIEDGIELGIYQTPEECFEVIRRIADSLIENNAVFFMPMPSFLDDEAKERERKEEAYYRLKSSFEEEIKKGENLL